MIKQLNETVDMMNSEDYKERFIAEYAQLKIRMRGLYAMLKKYRLGILTFAPKCSFDLLKGQYKSMELYESYLVERAMIEGIDLTEAQLNGTKFD